MAAEIPAKFVGLEKSVQDAAKAAGRNLKINVGANAKSVEALSQPLGRITGKADEFTKSMEAANARVLAFGASVGVLRSVTNSFKELVATTIQVEKQMASINAILGASTGELSKFKKEIFDVARNTEQSFETVSTAALELSRQGLAAEEVVKRLNDSLILSRLSGQSAADAVAGLTSAINGFKKSGVTSSQVVNKFSEAAKSAAVSERDLAEAFKRAGAVAGQAGVSFDELVGIVSAVQEKTSRGGSVIGNSFKTIFTRIQSLEKLKTMQNLGVEVTNASGDVLSATKIIQNLAGVLKSFPDARRLQIAENLVGKFQVAPFISLLEDYNDETSKAIKITEISANATTAAYERNAALNLTLSAAINEARVNVEQLFDTLGKIGVTEGLQNILGFFNNLVTDLRGLLDEDTGSSIAKGLVKGIGNVLSGPGLAIFGAIIGKLAKDLVGFGFGSIRTFFGINKAAKEQAALQGQIASTLLGNSDVQKEILKIENKQITAEQKKLEQTQFFTTALNEQFAIMSKMQGIAARVAPGVRAGTRTPRGAGGYIPNFAGGSAFGSEQADINRGVGGAPRSARPVAIPNFNFGGGQRGTMVANTSEFIVPNFGGGSAIFNQNMAASMGLPAGARPVGAAGGYIPNFAKAAAVNANRELILLTGTRKTDDDIKDREMFAGKVGKETRAYTALPTDKNVKSVRKVIVPTFNVRPKGKNNKSSRDIEDIKQGLSTAGADEAKLFAKQISGKAKLPTLTNKQIETLFNPGAFEGFAGSVFEVALSAILESRQFLDYATRTSTSRIDLPFSPQLYEKFGVDAGIGKLGAEAKANDDTGPLKSAAVKFYDILFGGAAVAAFKKQREISDDKTKATFLGASVLKKDAEKFGITTKRWESIQKDIQKDPNRSRAAIPTRGDIMLFKQRNAASGYVPNFVGALENAIGREAAAGIPINQIRINQKGTLRNSANPMGLAVTNTRDEPTGAIPNFQKSNITAKDLGITGVKSDDFAKKLESSLKALNEEVNKLAKQIRKGKITHDEADKKLKNFSQTVSESSNVQKKIQAAGNKELSSVQRTEKGQRDMLGTIFAVQAGLSLLTGATSDAEKGLGRFTNRVSEGLGTITTAAFAASALKDLGKETTGFMGKLGRFTGKLGVAGAAIFAAKGAFDMITNIVNDATGATDKSKIALAKLADSAEDAAFTLSGLSEVEKAKLPEKIEQARLELFSSDRQLSNFRNLQQTDPEKALNRRAIVLGGEDEGDLALENKGLLGPIIEKILQDSIVAGLDMEFVRKTIREQAVGGDFRKEMKDEFNFVPRAEILTFNELAKAQDIIQNIREETKTISEIFENLSVEDADFINDLGALLDPKSKQFSTRMGGANNKAPFGALEQFREDNKDKIEEFRKQLSAKGLANKEKQNKVIIEQAAKIRKNKDDLAEAAKKRIADLELDSAKIGIKSALEQKKAELSINVALEGRLAAAGVLNNLSKETLVKLDRQKFEEELQNKVIAQRIDLLVESLNKVDGLKASSEDVVAIQERISSLNRKDAQDKEIIALILRDILKITDKTDKEVEIIAKNFMSANDAAVKLTNTTSDAKRNVRDMKDDAMLLNHALQKAATAASIKSTNQAFEVTQALEREDVRDRDKITRLQQRLQTAPFGQRAALQDEIKSIESRIGQRAIDRTSASLFDKGMQLRADMLKQGTTKDFGGLGKLTADFMMTKEGATLQDMLSGLKLLASTTKDDGEQFRKQINNLGIAITRETESAKASAEAAELAALALNDFELAVANARNQLEQSERMGLISQAAADRRRLRAIENNPRLTPENASRLSDLRRSVGDRLMESGEFDPILQADRLAQTITDASISFKNNISDALVDAIVQGKSLGDSLRSAATDFFTMMSKAFMQKAVNSIVGVGGGSGGGGGNILSSILGFIGLHHGGMVRGGSGNRDDVPALLTGGEFVMKKSAVQKFGTGFMNSVNEGAVPKFANGGMFIPGSFGQGAIRGKSDLLGFATQTGTSTAADRMVSGANFAAIALAPESIAMTSLGRSMSPAFKRTQEAKSQAFNLFVQQLQADEQRKEQLRQQAEAKKQQKRGLFASLGMAALSGFVFGGGLGTIDKHLGALFGGRKSNRALNQELFAMFPNAAAKRPMGGMIPYMAGGGRMIDRPMGGMIPYAGGGGVGHAAGVDTVPAMLSGGEFVMNAAATSRIGASNLQALNSGASLGGGATSVTKGDTNINIVVNSNGSVNQSSSPNTEAADKGLAVRLKDAVKGVIAEETRLGGMLSA